MSHHSLHIAALVSLLLASPCFAGSRTNAPKAAGISGAKIAAADQDKIRVMFNNAYEMLYEQNEMIGRGDPDSPARSLLKLFNGATSTLDVCVYDIDDNGVVDSLLAAHARGVRVRVMTDSSNLMDSTDPASRRDAIVRLEKGGIALKGDGRSKLMHHKFVVVDRNSVWAGSMNFTGNALYRDNNNCLLMASPELAADFEEEFIRLFAPKASVETAQATPHPEVKVGEEAAVRVFFSPDGGGGDAIVETLKQARRSIHFMAFAFTDQRLAGILAEQYRNELKVEGVFDECQSEGYSCFTLLREQGVPVWRDGNQALLHHKVMIVDGNTVIAGSYNFTHSAEAKNSEDLLIIKSKTIAAQYEKEYRRIKRAAIEHHDIPPYDHPACGRSKRNVDPAAVGG